jgi:hypothetical protein
MHPICTNLHQICYKKHLDKIFVFTQRDKSGNTEQT